MNNNKESLHRDDNQFADKGGSLMNGFVYLLIGGGIGAVLALLFAPKPGMELRGDIADMTRRGYDETLERAQQLRDQSAEIYQLVKNKADEVYDFAAAKLSTGTKEIADTIDKGTAAAKSTLDEAGKILKHDAHARSSSNIV